FEFEPKQEIEKVKGDIRRFYFICPNCSKKYITYYLSSRIEKMQEKTIKLFKRWRETDGTNQKNKERYDRAVKSQQETKIEMQKLRKRFEEE
ncbi:MAG: hypothetical protein RSB87_07110, partial [Clostridia bacterium]